MNTKNTASHPNVASIGDDALWARTEDIRLRFANPTSIPRSTLLHYAECLLAHLATLRAPADQAASAALTFTINGRQLQDALDAAWPDRDDADQGDTELTMFVRQEQSWDDEGNVQPSGLWFYW